jgi:hypothetical protein
MSTDEANNANHTTDVPEGTEPDLFRIAGQLAAPPGGALCPTCGTVLPDLDREQELIEDALGAHSKRSSARWKTPAGRSTSPPSGPSAGGCAGCGRTWRTWSTWPRA